MGRALEDPRCSEALRQWTVQHVVAASGSVERPCDALGADGERVVPLLVTLASEGAENAREQRLPGSRRKMLRNCKYVMM